MKKISGLLLMGCSALALAGCGADDIASSGSGSVTINNDNSTTDSGDTDTDTDTDLVEAADSCPSFNATGGLTDDGTISDTSGNSWRVCTLPSLVDVSSSLPANTGVIYRLNGRVDVGCDGGFEAPTSGFSTTTQACIDAGVGSSMSADTDVTLTVDPGAIIYGENGSTPAWLVVNRGNKLEAEGTATKPIIFTSRQNVVGTATQSSQGQWGGVVLLGRGVITDCDTGSTTAGTCERQTEGASDPATFGGADNTYDAGTIKYVQIRYSGYTLSLGSELQSLTGGGVGTGTTFEYFQSVNSSDDGSEWFGGAVNFKHYISVNADDDSLDLDTGLQGAFQYVLLLQRADDGDAFMEIDSNNNESDTPRNVTSVVNFTAVQPTRSTDNSDEASILVRGNSDITLANGVIYNPENECIRINGSGSTSTMATLTMESVVMTCGDDGAFIGSGYYSDDDVQAVADAGSNNDYAFTSTLASTFVNGSNESGVSAFDVTTLSDYFDDVSYIGAVSGSDDTWYTGWTCDTDTADFGSDSLCTVLPTT